MREVTEFVRYFVFASRCRTRGKEHVDSRRKRREIKGKNPVALCRNPIRACLVYLLRTIYEFTLVIHKKIFQIKFNRQIKYFNFVKLH